MSSSAMALEHDRRARMWAELKSRGGPKDVPPALLRELGIYGAAQGVWVNQQITSVVSSDGSGAAVSVLHDGSSYADELTEDGLIYHFPRTRRGAGRDASEIRALENVARLDLVLFLITRGKPNTTRTVRATKIVDFDYVGETALITFAVDAPPQAFVSSAPFRLDADRDTRANTGTRAARDVQFKFNVGKRVGWKCAVCSISIKGLLDAAHIRGVSKRGSDDPRNGLILCANHHRAFDVGLFGIHPSTGGIWTKPTTSRSELKIETKALSSTILPHEEALQWHWAQGHENEWLDR